MIVSFVGQAATKQINTRNKHTEPSIFCFYKTRALQKASARVSAFALFFPPRTRNNIPQASPRPFASTQARLFFKT